MSGNAPCHACGWHIYNIPLITDTFEPDEQGGKWWRVEPGQSCPNCGEQLNWFHEPCPATLAAAFGLADAAAPAGRG